MLLLVLVLLLALVLGGAGFAVHALWWIALAVLVFWVLGFVFSSGGGGGRRWYRW
ncbi:MULTISPECIES: hydrophobic protein [unclassified Kitasatospora]|uniref:hydrophobic protein n=1 Tax=unclassified Kitasatospora TaxID=2633591 RepID=UPI001ADF5725|nr:hydrophobic protein [Kitasatospora sp. RG8]MBP0449134.1 hydrophobic protein [Kitasatospora sp. RG8]